MHDHSRSRPSRFHVYRVTRDGRVSYVDEYDVTNLHHVTENIRNQYLPDSCDGESYLVLEHHLVVAQFRVEVPSPPKQLVLIRG